MFACNFRANEVSEYYPEFSGTLIKESEVSSVLGRATKITASDLRNKGIDTVTIYKPRMFDGLDEYAFVEKSADFTSASIQPIGNETRFVAQISSGVVYDPCTFEIQGSQDDINWVDIASVEFKTDSDLLVSVDWANRFQYIRYLLKPEGTIRHSPYLVDTAYDEMIVHKAVMLVLSPMLKPEHRSVTIYEAAEKRYSDLLLKARPDIDIDNDGTIDSTEVSRKQSFVLMR